MSNSILNQVWRGLLPLALVGVSLAVSPPTWAQSDSPKSRVTAISGETDANLFDTRLIGGVPAAYDETAMPTVPPSAEHCVETPNLISPDAVFSPSAPTSPQASNIPSYGSLSAGQGALTAQNSVPAFMGDFFGGVGSFIQGGISSPLAGAPVSIPSSTAVGIMKLAENTSPLPRDRVFLSYNYFDNVNLIPGGMSVNRFTPGIEKTFFDGLASVEVRLPMALTLNSNTTFNARGSAYDTNQYELGNLTTFFKTLLYGNDQFSLAAGLGFSAPTADDTRIRDRNGATLALINNQSWHLLPFIGSVYTPNDRWYAQGLLQFDVPTNGNSVYTLSGNGLTKNGVLNDPAYLFTSIGTGYWMYQSADPSSRLAKVSLLTELHLNNSLQNTDQVRGSDGTTIGTRQGRIQTINAVVGTNLMFDQNKSLMLGYVAPIGGGSDQAFSGEFRLLFNWYYGGSLNRATRVQF